MRCSEAERPLNYEEDNMNTANVFCKETPESTVAYVPSEKADTLNVAGYDPFDEPLDTQFKEDELLVLDDVYFEAARNSVSLDGMTFSYLQPPYVNFENQNNAKKKIKECYNQKLFLLPESVFLQFTLLSH